MEEQPLDPDELVSREAQLAGLLHLRGKKRKPVKNLAATVNSNQRNIEVFFVVVRIKPSYFLKLYVKKYVQHFLH